MAPPRRAKSSKKKPRARSVPLRKQGLRRIQLWVPDVRTKAFARQARRESLAIANSPEETEDMEFIASLLR
jgi:hypothetical protein